MSRFVSCRCLLFAAAIGLLAFPSRGDGPPSAAPAHPMRGTYSSRCEEFKVGEAKIEQQLDYNTQLEFVETPLQDVIDYLKDYHGGIEIQIDSQKSNGNGAGIDGTTPVTKNIKGLSLRSALGLLLDELNLTYVVRDEVLLITTPERAAQMLSTRVYPIGDLASIASGKPQPAGTSAYVNPAYATPAYGPCVVRDESLENAIRTTVEPGSWTENGGPGTLATISLESQRVLVVRQTYAAHRQIATLLASLRKLIAKPRSAPASADGPSSD